MYCLDQGRVEEQGLLVIERSQADLIVASELTPLAGAVGPDQMTAESPALNGLCGCSHVCFGRGEERVGTNAIAIEVARRCD